MPIAEPPTRRFRKLRIVWSVVWGVVTALLCVLWVRTFTYIDTLYGFSLCGRAIEINSSVGTFSIFAPQGPRPAPNLTHIVAPQMVGNGTVYPDLMEPRWALAFGFRWKYIPTTAVIVIPLWFPVSLFAILAVVPWIRWRFTLRTLLITTTLFALLLGLAVYASRR